MPASNTVLSLALDDRTGKVFFGTDNGLSEAMSLSVLPLDAYAIRCFPQPYYNNSDKELVIEGLTQDSELKILTTNGELVRTIVTSSRKAVWDGQDDKGNPVSTGIYIISASSHTAGANSVGKIAVIRK